MKHGGPVNPIDDLLARYLKEFDYYIQVGRIAAARLEATIGEAGIRGIVTYRAKAPSRLRDKCNQRNKKKNYSSPDQIYSDIADLVGVRVALYFPGERDQVSGIIARLFDVEGPPKEVPRDGNQRAGKRFSGYAATHHRVYLRTADLTESESALRECTYRDTDCLSAYACLVRS